MQNRHACVVRRPCGAQDLAGQLISTDSAANSGLSLTKNLSGTARLPREGWRQDILSSVRPGAPGLLSQPLKDVHPCLLKTSGGQNPPHQRPTSMSECQDIPVHWHINSIISTQDCCKDISDKAAIEHPPAGYMIQSQIQNFLLLITILRKRCNVEHQEHHCSNVTRNAVSSTATMT